MTASDSIIIHIVEGHPTLGETVRALLRAIDQRATNCVTSELTIAEVLVKPIGNPDPSFRNVYEELLADTPGLRLFPVSRRILEHSAELRAVSGGKLADGIHIATAVLSGCSHFLSEDIRIKLPESLARLTLSTLSPLLQPAQESP